MRIVETENQNNSKNGVFQSPLYVTIIELTGSPETGMETAITNAKVSLAYGSIGGEQSMPAEWQDVNVNDNGQAIFLNVQPGVYREF